MTDFKFTLEPYKGIHTRYKCPACNKNRTFSKYIDHETGLYVSENVGRCNRVSKCGYHLTPKQYFQVNGLLIRDKPKKLYLKNNPIAKINEVKISLIPFEIFKKSLTNYHLNNFTRFLSTLFGREVTADLVKKYYIGTSKLWPGSTVFYQITKDFKIRTGKIILYDFKSGKRSKNINWVHSVLKINSYNLKQCFFGEHLLTENPRKTVAIVESEKTAIIASVYLPNYTWIAVGSLNNLSIERCKILKGYNVVLFPDLKGYDLWNKKALELSQFIKIKTSNLLESSASTQEKQQGLDIADYLIKFQVKDFKTKPFTHKEKITLTNNNHIEENKILSRITNHFLPTKKNIQISNWESDILELEVFFKSIESKQTYIKLEQGCIICDAKKFIESHLEVVRSQNGNASYKPYLERLQKLKFIIKATQSNASNSR